MNDKTANNYKKDYLWLNLRELPYFRGFLRAVEGKFYQEFELPSPILDLGCGDGQFASVTFDHKIDVGVDPWTGPVRLAGKTGQYGLVIQGNGDKLPFGEGYFSSAFSNSVLEHIEDLDPVLAEMGRVLKPGSIFVFCVPNQKFLKNLSISSFFDRVGLTGIGDVYRNFFNRISRHCHCDSPEVWVERLDKAGFKVEKWWHYFSPEALHVLEWGHYFGLPSLIIHMIARRWIILSQPWNLSITKKAVEKYYTEESNQPKGSYTFYIARRVG
jgi:SAM-dependent methyltransferase